MSARPQEQSMSADHPLGPSPWPAAGSSSSRPIGILVVDDDDSIRALLEAGLQQQGFWVWLAANGPEAVDLYRRQAPAIDLVLLDVHMPGLDGMQTITALRQVNSAVRCCLMSSVLPEVGASSPTGNSVPFFRKPFRVTVLIESLQRLLGRGASQETH